ncbi:MAG: hypothetical protein KFF50_15175, partial [Desulfatitalea sp.]|nr:hypothetical protein [Desulfatitalea sp.]
IKRQPIANKVTVMFLKCFIFDSFPGLKVGWGVTRTSETTGEKLETILNHGSSRVWFFDNRAD